MKSNKYFSLITYMYFGCFLLSSCERNQKFNEFNIYVSEDNPGWHFVDLTYDSIQKGPHKVVVRFSQGQTFQKARVRSPIVNYPIAFLYDNGDTLKSGFWAAGTYEYSSLQRTFVFFYLPSRKQNENVKQSQMDSIHRVLEGEMESIIENYLLKNNLLK